MACGIYGIFNAVNGKWYVGQSVILERRKICHFSDLRCGIHKNAHLQSAFFEYGEDSFEFRVLEETTEDMLDTRERAWIAHYNSINPKFGYNSDTGGHANKHLSADHKAKLAVAHTGMKHTPEHRAKISASNRGLKRSPEIRAKMSEVQKRLPHHISPEHRLVLSAAASAHNKGRKLSPEHCAKLAVAARLREQKRRELRGAA